MINPRLVMLEGLPSTGKTTNARFIHIQLERNNINTEWIHEVAMPNPVLFFDEACMTYDEYKSFIETYPRAADILNKIAVFRRNTVGIHLPEIEWNYKNRIGGEVYQGLLKYDAWNFPLEEYKIFALEKWEHFTENALRNQDKVYIIDSAIFQYQIFTFLLANSSYEVLQSFVDEIMDIINPLNPCLIYLYRENAETTIDYLENDRGTPYLNYIWDRDQAQPYYKDKPQGAEGFKIFLRDYAKMADLLFNNFRQNKLSLEISDDDWLRREDEMLSFLGINRIPSPDFLPQNGIYVNKALGYIIKVDGLSMTDPNEKTRKLYLKSHNEFYVDWLPTVLRFEADKIIIVGSQICDRWTETGMIYDRTLAGMSCIC